jgi:hypothetical protein
MDTNRRSGYPTDSDQVHAAELIDFLAARLHQELAQIWDRDSRTCSGLPRPGAAAQLAVVDDLLRTLSSGRLPERRELRILLHAYHGHPDYDPRWAGLLLLDR